VAALLARAEAPVTRRGHLCDGARRAPCPTSRLSLVQGSADALTRVDSVVQGINDALHG
jgi:hypothetical protein